MADSESPTVDADLRFSFRCPTCSTKCKSKVKHVGKRVDCPKCKASIVVPSYTGAGEAFEDLEMTDLLNRDNGSEWDLPAVGGKSTTSQPGPAASNTPRVSPTPSTPLPGPRQVEADAPTIRDDVSPLAPTTNQRWNPGWVSIFLWVLSTLQLAMLCAYMEQNVIEQFYSAAVAGLGWSSTYWCFYFAIRSWFVAKDDAMEAGRISAVPQFLRHLMLINSAWFLLGAMIGLLSVPLIPGASLHSWMQSQLSWGMIYAFSTLAFAVAYFAIRPTDAAAQSLHQGQGYPSPARLCLIAFLFVATSATAGSAGHLLRLAIPPDQIGFEQQQADRGQAWNSFIRELAEGNR